LQFDFGEAERCFGGGETDLQTERLAVEFCEAEFWDLDGFAIDVGQAFPESR
jgi:hypothetical protein